MRDGQLALRFQLFLQCATDYALLFCDADRIITEWTPGAEGIFGYRASDVIGTSADLIFTDVDRAAGLPDREAATALEQGQADDERWHKRADGSLLFASGRMVALRDEQGVLHGFAKIMRDVTAEKERDEKLQSTLAEMRMLQQAAEQSATKYREMFATANEGIWTLDGDAHIELVNERLAGMLGYQVSEMIGRVNVDFGFPEDVSRWRERFAERRRGLPAWIDVRFRHRRGHEVWALMSARPLFRGGQFAGELDMFTDITARRAAEQALRVSEEQFRTFFELAAAGHASIDPVTRLFLRVNRRFAEITGYAMEELRGRAFASLTHPDELQTDTQLFAKLLAGEVRELTQEKRFVHKSGRVVWVQINSSLVRDAEQQPLRQIVVVQDITARKLAEIELKDLKENLEIQVTLRTAQLEVKTAQLEGFCYSVAHDLRSPLRAISGYAELLLQDIAAGTSQSAPSYLSKITSASRRLDLLITDLLQYSRVAQAGVAIEDVSLRDVVYAARSHLVDEIEAKGAVVTIERDMPVVRAERPMLEQVMVNLLSNALKFVAPGTAPRIDVTVEHRGENVRLTIADNGIGIPSAYHRRIFGVFERLNNAREYPGTGVGLAIVQKAMERIGGTFGVESGSGEGSRFWIELRKAPA